MADERTLKVRCPCGHTIIVDGAEAGFTDLGLRGETAELVLLSVADRAQSPTGALASGASLVLHTREESQELLESLDLARAESQGLGRPRPTGET